MGNNQTKNPDPMVLGSGEYFFEDEYAVIDIETSGLDPTQDEIIEIGAVIIRDGEILDRFHTFVKAERSLQPWIIKLTGITDEMLRDAPNRATALEMFLRFWGDRPIVVSHAKFTLRFLQENVQQLRDSWEPTCIDVLGIARELFPRMKSHTLVNIARQVGVPVPDEKRPLDCAEVCAKVLACFFEEFRKKGIHSLQAIRKYEGEIACEQ